MVTTTDRDFELARKDFLNHFFDSYRNDTPQKQALKAFVVYGGQRRTVVRKTCRLGGGGSLCIGKALPHCLRRSKSTQ